MKNEQSFIKFREFIKSIPVELRAQPRKMPLNVFADDMLPFELYRGTRQNIESVADQINKSFCFGIYDGASVLMRRLIEMLLVLSFKLINDDSRIRDSNGNYLQLSQIISEAQKNLTIDLSRNAKVYLDIFKEKGDLSAHNPFHACLRKDLERVQPKFRYLIEELFYKSGILK